MTRLVLVASLLPVLFNLLGCATGVPKDEKGAAAVLEACCLRGHEAACAKRA